MQYYPRPDRWVNSPGDTALIVASGVGVALGIHAHKEPQIEAVHCEHCLEFPSFSAVVLGIPKMILGFFIILLTRAVFKSLMAPVCLWFAGPLQSKRSPTPPIKGEHNEHASEKNQGDNESDEEFFKQNPLNRYEVEIPLKFLTYIPIGFNTFCTIPLLFEFLGL